MLKLCTEAMFLHCFGQVLSAWMLVPFKYFLSGTGIQKVTKIAPVYANGHVSSFWARLVSLGQTKENNSIPFGKKQDNFQMNSILE